MRLRRHAAVAVESVALRGSPEVSLVPNRKLHRQRWKQSRFLSSPTKAGADLKVAAISGHLEAIGGIASATIRRIMSDAAQNPIQRDFLAGVKKVIDADGEFTPVAVE